MAAKKRAEKTVESIFFTRPTYRHAVAGKNLEDALYHTMKVLKKAKKKTRLRQK